MLFEPFLIPRGTRGWSHNFLIFIILLTCRKLTRVSKSIFYCSLINLLR